MQRTVFWIFGILQSISLAVIIFLHFDSLNVIKGERVIGGDTQLLLSVLFPLFLLLVEHATYTKKN